MKIGTYLYYAPELFDGGKFGSATDLWALGMTFYYLLTGRHPYEDAKGIFQLKEMVPSRQIDFKLVSDPEARHCIERMLDKNPATRATIQELLECDWVTKSGQEPVNVLVDG